MTAGTVLHGSKLPLTLWFWAAYLMATHSNGISALQLQKQLGLGSYKSAWLLCAKLRRAMVAPNRALLSGLVEVDETEVPTVQLGQTAKVTIDAVPNRTFKGHVTEIGNSPIQTTTQNTGQRQATTFKVVITIDETVPDVRPGFTCTAEITTATRQKVTSVPIQALTVRELLYDANGKLVHRMGEVIDGQYQKYVVESGARCYDPARGPWMLPQTGATP